MRHCQQDEVYEAERELHGQYVKTFESITEIQQFVDDLREERWWPAIIRRVEVHVAPAHERSRARWDSDNFAGVMVLSTFNTTVVLHELAHVIAGAVHGSESHDPWYCRTYLELVFRVLGSDAYQVLRDGFEMHDVIHDPEERP